MNILFTIIIFSILIVIHELGHFIAAKRAGVRVEKFAIGFGPPIFKVKIKETDFLICLFPLGGYVKLAGDSRAECKGRDYEFLSRPPGVKMRIVFAGPLFNYLMAFIIFCIVALIGFPYVDTIIGTVLEDYPAYNSGVQEGDKILEVNGKSVGTWDDMARLIHKAEEGVVLKVRRVDKDLLLEVPLKEKEIIDIFGRKKTVSMIGVSAAPEIKIIKYSLPKAIIKGGEALFNISMLVIKGFAFIILGVIPFKEAVAGPVGIYYITSEVMKIGIVAVLNLMAALNVSLAIINLFPIPVLDGGHLFFFVLEKIRKKPLREKTEDFLTRIGLSFIILLIIFIFYNDIIKFGPKIWKKNENSSSQITLMEEK